MISELKPYEKYRASGLPWLGDAPEHWETRRMKFLFRERTEKGHPDEPLLAATQTKGVVKKTDYETRTVTAQKDFHLLKLVEVGDFVISLRSFQGGLEIAHSRGIISPAYTILKSLEGVDTGYFRYFFKSPDFIRSLSLFVTGIREGQNIDYVRLSRSYMPLPPPNEQTAIVKFLDWANGRIDRAIRAKRKVIALLNEQKQTIIHRAVTRGIDPNVALEPSSIEWLAEVPKHWKITRLKFISRIAGRIGFRGYTTNDLVPQGEGALALGATHIKSDGTMTLDLPVYISWRKYFESPEIMVSKGDILIVQRGSTTGKIGFVSAEIGKATINPSLILISNIKRCLPEFLFLSLSHSSTKTYFRALLSSTAIPMVSQRQVGNATFALPDIKEQQAIVDYLKGSTKPISDAIVRIEKEIDFMLEFKNSLIADVVTGKLDVNAAAINLSTETEPAVAETDGMDVVEIEEDAELTEEKR